MGRTTVFVFLLLLGSAMSESSKSLVQVNDENWSDILEGEWMVEFFAPWCPACRSMQSVWEDFSTWGNDLGIKVGQVDITTSPGLSGRFMITALPTIYHIKDGKFRQYKGARTKDEFLGFVEEKRWEALEPISSWQSPASFQMTLISQFYKVSMNLRNAMNVLLEDYGVPTWAAYLLFGVLTILIGLILGLLLVCVIDFIYPPGPAPMLPPKSKPKSTSGKEKDSDDDTEEIKDEESQDEGEPKQDQQDSQQDTQSEAEPTPSTSNSPKSQQVRKRVRKD